MISILWERWRDLGRAKCGHLREDLECLTEKVIFSVSLGMIKSLTEGKWEESILGRGIKINDVF